LYITLYLTDVGLIKTKFTENAVYIIMRQKRHFLNIFVLISFKCRLFLFIWSFWQGTFSELWL